MDHSSPTTRPRAAFRALGAALLIGLCGAVVLALAEVATMLWTASAGMTAGAPWPWRIVAGAFLRAAACHALVWTPLLVATGLLRAIVGRPRFHLPLLAGGYVVVAGGVVALADLHLLQILSAARAAGTLVLLLLVGLLLGVALRQLLARAGRVRLLAVGGAKGGAVLALLGLAAWTAHTPSPGRSTMTADQPNVLLVVLDTVRADHTSLAGYPADTTPFLRRFAERGVTFEQAHSPGIWTVPGHAALFTGQGTREHGADSPLIWLDDAKTTLAETFRDHGYATACYTNNAWIGPRSNLHQGFAQHVPVHEYINLRRFSLVHLLECAGFTPPAEWLDDDLGAAATNALVADWLDGRDPRVPFLLFVNYMEAHAPYLSPERVRQEFMSPAQVGRSYALRRSVHGRIEPRLHLDYNIEGSDFLAHDDREVLARQYDAALRYLDERVAELIAQFERRGLLENTIVVITADHGEYLDEHGMWTHLFLAHGQVTHVPLVLRVPGGPEGVRCATPVQLSDLFGTLVRLATGERPPSTGHDARDLLDVAAAPTEDRPLVTVFSGPQAHLEQRLAGRDDPVVRHRAAPQVAVFDGRFRYLVSETGTQELYDLERDPGEAENILAQRPEVHARLSDWLERWRSTVPQFEPQLPAERGLDDEAMRAIAALGYAGGAPEEDDD